MTNRTFEKRLAALERGSHVTDDRMRVIFWQMKKKGNRLRWMLDEEKTLEEIAYGAIDWENPNDMWRVLRGLAQIRQASGTHERDELVRMLKEFLNTRGPSTRDSVRIPAYGGSEEDIQTANELSRFLTWFTIERETSENIQHKTLKDIPLTPEEQKHIDRIMSAADRECISRGETPYSELFDETE